MIIEINQPKIEVQNTTYVVEVHPVQYCVTPIQQVVVPVALKIKVNPFASVQVLAGAAEGGTFSTPDVNTFTLTFSSAQDPNYTQFAMVAVGTNPYYLQYNLTVTKAIGSDHVYLFQITSGIPAPAVWSNTILYIE